MKNIAVILAGSGRADGSEIHEATLTLYFIAKNQAKYTIFAPDIMQYHTINHISGEEMSEKRNVLVEAARIARGEIKPLTELQAQNFDALIIPGGFGAAKNLCNYALEGDKMKVIPELEKVINDFYQAKKPIGALCIAPMIIAKVLKNIELTIGHDRQTAEDISKIGAKHIEVDVNQIVIDKKNKIVSTPCYMEQANIYEVGQGIEKLVEKVIELS